MSHLSAAEFLDFCDVVGDGEFTWKALREVNLAVNTNEEELITFLIRHKKTLRRLTINDESRLEEPEDSAMTLVLGTRAAVQWKEISVLDRCSS